MTSMSMHVCGVRRAAACGVGESRGRRRGVAASGRVAMEGCERQPRSRAHCCPHSTRSRHHADRGRCSDAFYSPNAYVRTAQRYVPLVLRRVSIASDFSFDYCCHPRPSYAARHGCGHVVCLALCRAQWLCTRWRRVVTSARPSPRASAAARRRCRRRCRAPVRSRVHRWATCRPLRPPRRLHRRHRRLQQRPCRRRASTASTSTATATRSAWRCWRTTS